MLNFGETRVLNMKEDWSLFPGNKHRGVDITLKSEKGTKREEI